jgi:uncharacterized membrane protein
MRLDLSLLGWIHTLACLAALALGALNLLRRKGTPSHRRIGHWYLWSILAVSISALGIYRFGRFFFPHWFAVATIIFAALAYTFARFKRPRTLWLRLHIFSSVLTYYLLVAGGVNEAFLRIDVLRRLSGGFPSPVIGMTHNILIGLTAIVLIWFMVKFRGRRVATQESRVDLLKTAR